MTIFKPKTESAASPVSETVKKRKRKFPSKWLIAAVVLLAVVFAVTMLFRGAGPNNAAMSVYTTAEVSTRSITKSLSGSGTLQPANSYTVVTLVEGEVLAADFEEGNMVEKDTVLYQVDSSDAATNIEKAQISLAQAQRSYSSTAEKQYVKAPVSGMVYSLDVRVGDEITQGQTIAAVRDSSVMILKVPFPADDAAGFYVGQDAVVTLDSTFETLPGTVAEISGADIVGTGNRITRNVTVEVHNPGGLSDTQAAAASINGINCAGNATLTYRADSTVTATASGTVTSVHVPEGHAVSKGQAILTLGGDDMENQIQSAAESLRNAELSMESTQDQLENYTITSPISGTIIDKLSKAGDTVKSGAQLCTIYDLSYLEMTLNIDELDISDLAAGQSVRITADAVEGREFAGVVTKVSVAGTTSGGITSYPVTVRISETDGLLPGMNVNAEIVISEVTDVLTVPNDAVMRGDVILVPADSPSAVNAVEQEAPEGYVYVRVETGLSDDHYVEILSGLQSGDTVAYVPASTGNNSFEAMFGAGGPGGPGGGGPFG